MDEARLKPIPEMQRVIELLEGSWELNVTYEPTPDNPSKTTAKGKEVSRRGPGSFSVVFETDTQDETAFTAIGIIEWSPKESVYLLHWLNSLSPTGAFFKGSWEGEDLVFNGRESMMGPELASRHSIAQIKPDGFIYTIDMGPSESELQRVITIDYKKIT